MTTRDDNLTGTWMHPTGVRTEVRCEDGQWRIYTFMTRRGTRPAAVYEFDDPDKLAEVIAELERQGHVRQVEGQPAPPRPASQNIGIALLVLSAICVLVVVLALTA